MAAYEFITLSCPSCGGKLQITSDIERFACSYCGNEQVVRRGGGIVSLAPVMEGLQRVQASTDIVAAELAVQRLTREMADAQQEIEAAKSRLAKSRQNENRFTPVSLWTLAAVGSTLGLCLFGYIVATGAGTSDILSLAGACVVCAIISWPFTLSHFRHQRRLKKATEAAATDIRQAENYYFELTQRRDGKLALTK